VLLLLLAVAREAVQAERESECRQSRVMRGVGEAVGACGKQSGERARPEQVLVRIVGSLEREQDAGQAAFRARQQQVPAGVRPETGRIGEAAVVRIKSLT